MMDSLASWHAVSEMMGNAQDRKEAVDRFND